MITQFVRKNRQSSLK